MISFNGLISVALVYVAFLFLIAFLAERHSLSGKRGWISSSAIYTLSLSIYCTAWTFYGAVGYAARSGFEYLTIYLGPTIIMVGWWWILRKLVRIGRAQRITSIADLISSRYGKSTMLGVIVTLLAVIGTTPYIALQLQSVTQSISVFAHTSEQSWTVASTNVVAIWVAVGLAIFTIIFGTRNLDLHERHHGVVIAIAVEAIVKLFALAAVGIFVVWSLGGGVASMLNRIDQSNIATWHPEPSRWAGLIFLSAAAFLCLPRMFQVLVVENCDEKHLSTAAWAFPLYLLIMSLFTVPIAVMGLELLPPDANPDLFVLTLPLESGNHALAVLSFLGGFSSATSMVIVATIALATMVSNHIVVPIWLRTQSGQSRAVVSGDVRNIIVMARRLSIALVLTMGYLYFRMSGGGEALAAIGLISFAGVVQVLPAMIGGIFWRGANRLGAAAGLVTGFTIWLWTLFLPSAGAGGILPETVMQNGPWGIEALRPHALFYIDGVDPVIHAVFWSMLMNFLVFFVVSAFTFPSPIERLQGAQFVNIFEFSGDTQTRSSGIARAEDLLVMAQRTLGASTAQTLFQNAAHKQGKSGYLPDVTSEFVGDLEKLLAGSVGAATAHAMIGQITGGSGVSVDDLMAVADETAQIMEYSSKLEAKSTEQERTARALREANEKLTAISIQKDAFLSQISHELRTPMTSIRSFSEILEDENVEQDRRVRYAKIIHDESSRLTRLLDDLLDISVLESGRVQLSVGQARIKELLDTAVRSSDVRQGTLRIVRDIEKEKIEVESDLGRLTQVFINLITNAAKYCDSETPQLTIQVHRTGSDIVLDFIDNGTPISEENQDLIFEKFSRLNDAGMAGGAGLGLAICRQIMTSLGGNILYLPGQGGPAFRIIVPAAK